MLPKMEEDFSISSNKTTLFSKTSNFVSSSLKNERVIVIPKREKIINT